MVEIDEGLVKGVARDIADSVLLYTFGMVFFESVFKNPYDVKDKNSFQYVLKGLQFEHLASLITQCLEQKGKLDFPETWLDLILEELKSRCI